MSQNLTKKQIIDRINKRLEKFIEKGYVKKIEEKNIDNFLKFNKSKNLVK